MPKYAFNCESCDVEFTRTLKMDKHPSYECPTCGEEAPRVMGSFGFSFNSQGKPPGNTGVSKHDHPSADQAVGRDSEARWAEYDQRAKIKEKVREKGGTHALIRKTGKDFIDYTAGGDNLVPTRKRLAKEASENLKRQKPQ